MKIKEMILFHKHITIIFLFEILALGSSLQAQNDSAKSEKEYDIFYQLLFEDRMEINHLWKFDAIELARLVPNIRYEHKLNGDWTLQHGALIDWRANTYREDYYTVLNANLFSSIRYYYNKGRRKRLGKNVNSFVGNYFGSQINLGFQTSISDKYKPNNYFTPGSYVLYGLQRRLGKIMYLDFFFGLGAIYNFRSAYFSQEKGFQFMSTIGFDIGFTFENLKFKRLK